MSDKRIGMGDTAPDFTLPSHSGDQVSLHDLLARGPLVLYFYPKDNTSGCTVEACSFRDSYSVFKDAGVEVAGISSDSVASHENFASRNRLPFILLSDTGSVVRKQYSVPSTLGVLPGRVTYVIDREGVIRQMFSSQMGATKHVSEALRMIDQLQRS